MNTHKLKLAALLLVFSAWIAPQTSEAYYTTNQQSYKIDDHTALFTITYSFGFENRDVYMPIGANRNNDENDDFYLSYEILDDGTKSTIGNTYGLALTKSKDVTIENNMYFVPAGSTAEFTFYVLTTLTDTEVAANPDLALQVTRLPFTMVSGPLTIEAHLNPSELTHYQTPELDM